MLKVPDCAEFRRSTADLQDSAGIDLVQKSSLFNAGVVGACGFAYSRHLKALQACMCNFCAAGAVAAATFHNNKRACSPAALWRIAVGILLFAGQDSRRWRCRLGGSTILQIPCQASVQILRLLAPQRRGGF